MLPFAELWEYRELLYFFVWRDIKIRYKQTAIGAAWAMLQPFLTMLMFSLFFGRLAHIYLRTACPSRCFYYSALLPWTFFAASIQNAQPIRSSKISGSSPKCISRAFKLPLSARSLRAWRTSRSLS